MAVTSSDTGTLTVTNATKYSDPFPINGSRITLVVAVSSSASTQTVTLQGSIDQVTWVDTAHTAAALNNTTVQIGPGGGDGTIFNAWPYYRIKSVPAGSASTTVTWVTKGLE